MNFPIQCALIDVYASLIVSLAKKGHLDRAKKYLKMLWELEIEFAQQTAKEVEDSLWDNGNEF